MSKMDSNFDICIVGGGAAGLVAAITAARLNKTVCLFDSNKQLGKKLLSTGNGRCNYTNSNMNSSFFYSSLNNKDEFVEAVLSNFSYKDTLEFFESIGINGSSINGYYYPYTNQASSIRDALDREIRRNDITVFIDRRVTDISKVENGFRVQAYSADITAEKLIISTGGLVSNKLGCLGDGYNFAEKFGHNITTLHPGLTALTFNDFILTELAGVRCYGSVLGQAGEIQWNKDSISGIPVMCASRQISKKFASGDKLCEVMVDLLPEISLTELIDKVSQIKNKYFDFTVKDALSGLVNDKCLDYCIKVSGLNNDDCIGEILESKIKSLCTNLKQIKVPVNGTKDYSSAQVTAGGIDLSQINSNTMESLLTPDLYFAGEVLDVDGICGGYNLQWAFATGYISAKGACEL